MRQSLQKLPKQSSVHVPCALASLVQLFKETIMSAMALVLAEQRYAEMQKRHARVIPDTQSESQQRIEKTARLRELRLAKEAEVAAIDDVKSVEKDVVKKSR